MKKKIDSYFTMISQGILLSLCILAVMFAFNKDTVVAEICLYEMLPSYKIDDSMKMLFKLSPVEVALSETETDAETATVFSETVEEESPVVIEQIENTVVQIDETELIGLNDIVYQPETDYTDMYHHFQKENFTIEDVSALRDLANLKSAFYIVDKRTDITPEFFNIDEFLNTDLSINTDTAGPKVLIFHTHSREDYSDSKPELDSKNKGVVGVGNLLREVLEKEYGIEAMHVTESFDVVDGKTQVMGAYQRMEPVIQKILKENPSIQVAIDIHRDGVVESTHLVNDINGKKTAQIMFVNGLSHLNKNGVLEEISGLNNPNLKTNLAFSFNMQLAANSLFPGFTRKVYLNAYRYSLHMLPKSLLVEVGAQTNTEEEARNAVYPLAETLAQVILN